MYNASENITKSQNKIEYFGDLTSLLYRIKLLGIVNRLNFDSGLIKTTGNKVNTMNFFFL